MALAVTAMAAPASKTAIRLQNLIVLSPLRGLHSIPNHYPSRSNPQTDWPAGLPPVHQGTDIYGK
ncbi:hypothetical protein GCM10010432_40060 [Catellatospora methionotrophica]